MITYEKIVEVNKKLAAINVKGKDYIPVNERVKAFRMLYPNGCIETDIVSADPNGEWVAMKTTVYDDEGRKIATGFAHETRNGSMINRSGSMWENCESSSCGRALGFAGLGIDTAICSADELINALARQEKRMIEEDSYYDALCDLMMQKGVTEEQICKRYKVANLRALSDQQYTAAAAGLQKMKDVSNDDASRN